MRGAAQQPSLFGERPQGLPASALPCGARPNSGIDPAMRGKKLPVFGGVARDHPALRAGPRGATVHLRRWPVKCSQCTFRGSCAWPSGRTRSLAESVSTREPTPQRARWGLWFSAGRGGLH